MLVYDCTEVARAKGGEQGTVWHSEDNVAVVIVSNPTHGLCIAEATESPSCLFQASNDLLRQYILL